MSRATKTKQKRYLSAALAFAIAFVSLTGLLTAAPPQADAADKTISQIEKEQKELDQKIKDTTNKINQTQKEISNAKDKQAKLQSQIGNVENQLALTSQSVELVNEAIAVKGKEIDTKLAEIEESEIQFAERVHRMYVMQNSSTTLSTLFEAKSFADLMNRMEVMKYLSESDKEAVDALVKQKEDLNGLKAELEGQQAKLVSQKSNLSQQEKNLNGLYSEVGAALSEAQQQQKQYMENKAKFAQQEKQLEKQMAAALEALKSAAAYGDGILKWPVPGYTKISSNFGWRWLYGKRDWHTGIDISTSGRIGPSIVAADAGKVVWTKQVSYGYGNHLLIDHGNGVSTLYAHCNRILVGQGAMVAKGQAVAQVGTTGNSTGPHLHFEVRINNVQQNPINYVRATG